MEADGKTPPSAVSAETLAWLLRRAVTLMLRAHHRQGHAEHAQMRVLAILREHAPMNQRTLLEMLHVRSASLSELLGKLEQRNLIARSRDERDKRNVMIALTRQATTAGSTGEQGAEPLFTALGGGERAQLAKLLGKLVASLEQQSPDHPRHDPGDGHRHEHGRHHRAHGRRGLQVP